MIEFVVFGNPKGKARPRFTKQGRVYTPKETKEYEAEIRKAYLNAGGGVNFNNNAVEIQITAYFQRAKSSKRVQATTKPDLDNIIKAVLDGLNGAAFDDDKQVVEIHARKLYCTMNEPPHIKVKVIEHE